MTTRPWLDRDVIDLAKVHDDVRPLSNDVVSTVHHMRAC
jgi:hypothetical protein